jgi:hypothetical protein
MLIGPRVFFQKNVCILEAFEKDLKTALFLGKWFAFTVMCTSVPEVVEECLGGESNNVCVRYEIGP